MSRLIFTIAGGLIALLVGNTFPPAVAGEEGAVVSLQSLYRDGRFEDVVAQARKIGTADAMALAARAQIARAVSARLGEAHIDTVHAAEDLARAALAKDDRNVEALVQLVVALGLRARHMGPMSAYILNLATEAKIYLDRAYRLAPQNPVVLAVYGAWHLEVAGKAGPQRAASYYGASLDQGKRMFERALATEPDNILFLYNEALLLLAFDQAQDHTGNRREAVDLLERIQRSEPRDRLQRVLQSRAADLLNELIRHDEASLSALVLQQLAIV